jgi:glycosyltransferase involved in cell wall biosynthesis
LFDVSVIICCHNSAGRIRPVLDHLRIQRNGDGFTWEIVVVDNGSKDRIADVASESWNVAGVPLRIVAEPKLGLTYARQKGASVSAGEILIFCDDDNWLDENYVENCHVFMRANPRWGAITGTGQAASEIPLPHWFTKHQTSYACGLLPSTQNSEQMLAGAALAIRRSAWQRLVGVGFSPLLSDRRGDALASGGDTELTMALSLAGWELHLCSELSFKHFMPPARLTEEYLLRLKRGLGAAYPVIREYRRVQKKAFRERLSLSDYLPFPVLAFVGIIRGCIHSGFIFFVKDLNRRVIYSHSIGRGQAYFDYLKTGEAWHIRAKLTQFTKRLRVKASARRTGINSHAQN